MKNSFSFGDIIGLDQVAWCKRLMDAGLDPKLELEVLDVEGRTVVQLKITTQQQSEPQTIFHHTAINEPAKEEMRKRLLDPNCNPDTFNEIDQLIFQAVVADATTKSDSTTS